MDPNKLNKEKDEKNTLEKSKWLCFKKWVYKNHKIISILCLLLLLIIEYFRYDSIGSLKGGASPLGGMGGSLTNKVELGKAAKFNALTGASVRGGMERARQGASVIWDFLYQVAFVIIVIIIIFPSIGLFLIGIICYTLLKRKMSDLKKL